MQQHWCECNLKLSFLHCILNRITYFSIFDLTVQILQNLYLFIIFHLWPVTKGQVYTLIEKKKILIIFQQFSVQHQFCETIWLLSGNYQNRLAVLINSIWSRKCWLLRMLRAFFLYVKVYKQKFLFIVNSNPLSTSKQELRFPTPTFSLVSRQAKLKLSFWRKILGHL